MNELDGCNLAGGKTKAFKITDSKCKERVVSKATVDEEQADESIDQNHNESELEAKKALDKEKLYLLYQAQW